jgi:hypothetical protein
MKESYGEGLATHPDPESCGTGREARDEALTGAWTGRVLSREIGRILRGADAVHPSGRRDPSERNRERRRDPARSMTPCMPRTDLHENREISGLATAQAGVRVGKSKDARRR